MNFFITIAILSLTCVMVKAQYYGAAPFHNVYHASNSEAAAHHDTQGAFAEEAVAGLLDAHHSEQHDMAHDLANGYGLHEHDEEHHGLHDGLHRQYAARAAQGAYAVHNDAQQHHAALAVANAGHFGYGYGPYGVYRHGFYGPYADDHALYGHGFNTYAPFVGHNVYAHL